MTGTVVRVNRATTTITGFLERRRSWAARSGRRSSRAYRVPIVQAMFAEPDGSAIPGTREANASPRPAETLRVVWNNDLVRDEDGTPRYAVMTGVDVTGRADHRRA